MKIVWSTGSRIYVDKQTAEALALVPGRISLHFGAWYEYAALEINQEFPRGTIGLPQQWRTRFTIPSHLPYELYRKGSELHVGPVLALFAFQEQRRMTPERMNLFRGYFNNYGAAWGLLYLCAVDGIDARGKTIQGYYYDPDPEKASMPWVAGTFPYPGAAYNRTVMSRGVFDELMRTMGNRLFNSYSTGSFNKWELWNRLSPDERLSEHLPSTAQVMGEDDLNGMLDKCRAVYLKPAGGTLSEGVMKVKRTGSGYRVLHPNREKGGAATIERLIEGPEIVKEWVRTLKNKDYIVQQAIAMKKYKKMPIDFRVMMQKNGSDEWQCSGIFGRFGKRRSIITNFIRSGCLRSGMDSLVKAFGMSKRRAELKLSEMKSIALHICKVFDQYGNYGDVGIDLMIDKHHKVWILEVNTLDTYHQFPLHLKDREHYLRVVAAPFAYAKYLSGFVRE